MSWQELPTHIFKVYVGAPLSHSSLKKAVIRPGKSKLQSYPKEKERWPEINDKDKPVNHMDGKTEMKTAYVNTSHCFS